MCLLDTSLFLCKIYNKRVSFLTILIFLISTLIVGLDQIFKYIVVNNLKPNGNITVINGLLDFTYLENRGAAFGIFSNQRYFFIITTCVVMIFLIYVAFFKVSSLLFNVSIAFIIGGGIGNLIDRIFLGYVIDYIQVSFFPPVCNFADYCITFGTMLLFIWIIFGYEKNRSESIIKK